MRVVGVEGSTSAGMLREKLGEVVSDRPLHWGTQGDGYGGQRKLRGYEQLMRLTGGEGTPPVKWTVPHAVITLDDLDVDLYVGRKNDHTQGRDIQKCRDSQGRIRPEFLHSDYWVRWLDTTEAEEWRIHVAFGKSIARGKKVHTAEADVIRRRQEGLIVRSRKVGWRLDHTPDPPKGIRTAAKEAVLRLGYDFGAVDVLYWPGTPARIVVLEVNSAPGLDEYTCGKYVQALIEKAQEDGREE